MKCKDCSAYSKPVLEMGAMRLDCRLSKRSVCPSDDCHDNDARMLELAGEVDTGVLPNWEHGLGHSLDTWDCRGIRIGLSERGWHIANRHAITDDELRALAAQLLRLSVRTCPEGRKGRDDEQD